MRVMINALSPRYGGALTYALNQMGALARVRPDWQITVLACPANREVFEKLPGLDVETVGTRGLGSRLAFEQCVLPLRTRKRADVLYCLGNFIPLVSETPRVVVQQNMRLFGRGRRMSSGVRVRAEAALARASVRRAEGVVVISESLLKELEHDGLASQRCEVVLSGSPDQMPEASIPPSLEGIPQFFLSVADDYPHKRLDDVVSAWGALPGDGSTSLVLAGSVSPDRIEHHQKLVRPERRARLLHLGSVAERAQLRWLYENALALVATSELEAFPLTPGEAGAVGCPLVLSDIPAHSEVSEGRGTYFTIGDVDALTAKLDAILRHPPSRDTWARRVTWDMNAEQIAVVLEKAAEREGLVGRRHRT